MDPTHTQIATPPHSPPQVERAILHVDMDAFFASVEQRDDPALKGRPVLVGYDGPRGVVAAASYEARQFGCHSAQPISIAKRRCPEAVIVPIRGRRYHEASEAVFAILGRVTPIVQPLSIDEAFLDVTGSRRLLGDARKIATSLKTQIRDEVGLIASVGAAPNKFLAKLASDMDKPDGLTVIDASDVDRVLLLLPVSALPGVGPAAAQRLHRMGIRDVAALRKHDDEELTRHLGSLGTHLRRLAFGIDHRPVVTDRSAKSISHERTFETDVASIQDIRRTIAWQSENVARRLRKAEARAACVSIKVRFGDFETITRSTTLNEATDLTTSITAAALELFDRWASNRFHPVRLIGVGASRLSEGSVGKQLGLFTAQREERARKVERVADDINAKFGRGAIRRSSSLGG